METKENVLKRRKKPKKDPHSIVFFTILGIFLGLVSLFLLYSPLFGLMTSLKSPDDFSSSFGNNVLGFPSLDPKDPYNSRQQFFKWSNYAEVFKHFRYERVASSFYQGGNLVSHEQENVNVGRMLLNTLLYAGGVGLIRAVFPAVVAYLCAKYDYKFSKIVFVVFTFMLAIPIVGSYPTEITLLRNNGFYDTFYGIWIQAMGGEGMYFFVYYAFFKSQSNAYKEAAEIDGANDFTIMFRIYMPMAAKIIFTVFLIQFVTYWNDFQTPMLYLPTHPTLALGVFDLTKSGSTISRSLQNEPMRLAATMMLAIPIAVFFAIFKDRLMGNITFGGIKE